MCLVSTLHKYFEHKVVVLIDNYYAFVISVLSKVSYISDAEKTLLFFKRTIAGLLNNNGRVIQALLTGVLPVCDNGFRFNRSDINFYWFMRDESFSRYFGLNFGRNQKTS